MVGREESYQQGYVWLLSLSTHLLTDTDTWIGMGLALGGIALCVQSKT